MRLTHEAQVMPSIGRTISIGRGASGVADILPGVYRAVDDSRRSHAGRDLRVRARPASRARPRARSAAAARPLRRRGSRPRPAARATGRTASTRWRRTPPRRGWRRGRPTSGSAIDGRLGEHVEAGAQRPGDGHGEPLGVRARAWPRPGERPDAMLLADQRRAQHVVDAAVEDHDVLAADDLAVDDPRDVGAGRPDQEPPGLEQDARGGAWPGPRRAGRRRGEPRAERREVERRLVASYGIPSPPPASTSRSRNPAVAASRRASRRSPRRAPPIAAASSTLEAPKAWTPERLEPGRGDGLGRRARAGRRASIPNLPAPSSPTSRTRSSRGAPTTAAGAGPAGAGPAASAIVASRRSSPTRLDRHGAHAGVDGGGQLLVALARARSRRRASGDEAGAQGVAQLAAGRDVRAQPEPGEVPQRPRGSGSP